MIKFIKNNSVKFISSVFILLSFIILSNSLFASDLINIEHDNYSISINKDSNTVIISNEDLNIYQEIIVDKTDLINWSNCIVSYSNYNDYPTAMDFSEKFCFVFTNELENTYYTYYNGSKFGYRLISFYSGYVFKIHFYSYNNSPSLSVDFQGFNKVFNNSNGSGLDGIGPSFWIYYNEDNSRYNEVPIIIHSDIDLYSPDEEVIYQNKISTTFDYDFIGINRDKVQLKVSNLDSSYKFLGFVGLDNTFNIGDTFTLTDYISKLRITTDGQGSYIGNLWLGEVVSYLILDENNVIQDVGQIDNMANGYLLWAYEYAQGVDFAFIKDGDYFWSDDLDFIWSGNNGIEYTDDQIITIIPKYVEVDNSIYSNKVIGKVIDSTGNVICSDELIFLSEQSAFKFEFRDISYSESSGVLTPFGIFSINEISLKGTDKEGKNIDFSNYYIKWNVSAILHNYSVNPEVLLLNNEELSVLNGILNYSYSNADNSIFDFNLVVKKRISDYVPFYFTFYVYDNNNQLVHTEMISSDKIIQRQVDINNNTGSSSNNNFDIMNNPSFGSSNDLSDVDINNITNWTEKDFQKLLSTDNFVWEFFKAILGNLPWWIYVPLIILIFGVVFISLLRIIRGA